MNFLWVFLGGGLGSVLRYWISKKSISIWPDHPFLPTMVINILGSFLIGYLIGLVQKTNNIDSVISWALIAGFCGGFTTFSTFSIESLNLIQGKEYFVFALYIGLSIFIGISAAFGGLMVGKI